MIEEIAPAKINLYLHVGAIRDDGFHELRSLFVFADDGDRLTVSPADHLSLEVKGPFSGALANEPIESNLVYQSAKTLQAEYNIAAGAALVLEKRLPVAAGVGGGSADAAAALRALGRLWKIDASEKALQELAFGLGADIPACLSRHPLNVSGAGEELSPGPDLPPLWVCLVNPGVEMPTGPVFQAFDLENPNPSSPAEFGLTKIADQKDIVALFAETRNDLQPYAVAIKPEIAETLRFLADSAEVLGSRMSGSGATCFALFASEAAAENCAAACRSKEWWTMASAISRGEA